MTESKKYSIPKEEGCTGYSNMGCVEIRLDTMADFVNKAKELRPEKIWSCYAPICNKFTYSGGENPDFERQKPHSEIFFFVKENTIYSAESMGYRSIEDYRKSERFGFEEDGTMLLYDVRKRYVIESLAELYYTAVRHGYSSLKDFRTSYNFYGELEHKGKFTKDYREAKKLGYKKYQDFLIGNEKKFEK